MGLEPAPEVYFFKNAEVIVRYDSGELNDLIEGRLKARCLGVVEYEGHFDSLTKSQRLVHFGLRPSSAAGHPGYRHGQ